MSALSTTGVGSSSLPAMTFDILNLVRKPLEPSSSSQSPGGSGNGHPNPNKPPTLVREWNKVGSISPGKSQVQLETIRWPGGGIFGPGESPSKAYRVVTIVSPPFVMETEAEDNRTCVKGLPCLKIPYIKKNKVPLPLYLHTFL